MCRNVWLTGAQLQIIVALKCNSTIFHDLIGLVGTHWSLYKRRCFEHHGDKMTSWPAGLWPCCIFSLDVCCLLWLWRQRSTSVCLTDPACTKKGPQQCSTELWEQTEFSEVYSWWTSAFIFVLVHIYQQYLHVGKKNISVAGIIWSFAAICRLIIVWCCVSFLCVQMRLFGKHELTFNRFWSSGFIWTAGQDAVSHRGGTLLSHAFRINSVFAEFSRFKRWWCLLKSGWPVVLLKVRSLALFLFATHASPHWCTDHIYLCVKGRFHYFTCPVLNLSICAMRL